MKHTGVMSLLGVALTAVLGVSDGLAAHPLSGLQPPLVKDLVTKLRQLEKAVKSLEMELVTKDRLPNGVQVESHGSVRVLKPTHFQTSVRVTFSGEVKTEMQTVVTPKGVWTRRREPIEEVCLFMKPELRQELEEKTRKLGAGAKLPGPVAAPGGLLGSAMLSSLNQQFDLKVIGHKEVGKFMCLELAGDRRQPKDGKTPPTEGPLGVPIPTKAIVLVRESDFIPIRMEQFGRDGKSMITFEITKLVVDAKLDPSSFKIDKAEGVTFLDVEKHPPSWAQILRVREAYAALEEKGKVDSQPQKDKEPAKGGGAASRKQGRDG